LFVSISPSGAEVGTAFIPGFSGAEASHATGAFVVLLPAGIAFIRSCGATTGGFLRNGGTAGAAWPVELLFGPVFDLIVSAGEAASHRLGFIKTVVTAVLPAAPETALASAPGWSGFVVEIGGAPRLLGGDATQAHAFVGEENGCPC
jgi:hypothetical protein